MSITSEKEFRAGQFRGDFPPIPEEFRHFFGDDFDRFFEMPKPDQRGMHKAFGSGVIGSDSHNARLDCWKNRNSKSSC